MKPATLQFYKERLLRVLVHLQERLDHPPSLEELGTLAGLAPYHFHHVFTGMIGESLGAHLRRLRLERAASRLKLSRTPIIQIALEAGYETHESFSRAFRAGFGQSPRQFRQRHTAPLQIHAPSGVHYDHHAKPNGFRTTRPHKLTMNVTVKHFEPQRVAFMRHVGPYKDCGPVWGRLTMLLGKDGWLGAGTQFIGISHDDPAVTPPDRIRYDACVSVDDSFKPSGDVGVQIIAGGDYAVLTHLGPYENLSQSYHQLLGQWLPRSGRKLRPAPCFETYLNSPQDTEPADLITDLHAPLE